MKFFAVLASFVAVALAAPTAEDKPLEARNETLAIRQDCYVPQQPDWGIIQTVYNICRQKKCTSREMLATFEAGLVESNFHNLNCGDKDSEGVFQQRVSMKVWGEAWEIRNVPHATNAFLGALFSCTRSSKSRGWSAGRCAQCAQSSEIPLAYDRMESRARQVLNEAQDRFGGFNGGGDGAANVAKPPPSSGGGGNNGSCDWTYTVKGGDTCSKIAKTGHTNAQNVINLNNGVINKGCTNLRAGQKICLRRKAGGTPSGGNNQGRKCSWQRKVIKGDTCSKIAGIAKLKLSTFMSYNSGRVNSGCTNLRIGQSLCMN